MINKTMFNTIGETKNIIKLKIRLQNNLFLGEHFKHTNLLELSLWAASFIESSPHTITYTQLPTLLTIGYMKISVMIITLPYFLDF